MSFPATPVNNQIALVNGINYIYSTVSNTWTRTLYTLSTASILSVTSNTNATSTTTGAVTVGGGLGVSGNVYFGGNIYQNGNLFVATGAQSTSSATPPSNPTIGDIWYNTTSDDVYRYTSDGTTSAWLDINGPVAVTSGNNTVMGNITIVSNLRSNSTTSGALTVAGGTGITGNLYVGSNIVVTGNVVPAGSGAILAVPSWVSAGVTTIGATTTAPTKGTTTFDNISYRQVGQQQWEIAVTYLQTIVSANAGSGDYLITLPNSLQFNTSLASQQIYTGSVGTSTWGLAQYIIPTASGTLNNYGAGSPVGGQTYPIIWNATQFRILVTAYGNAVQCWGSGYFSITDYPKVQLTFRFTSL